jgi:DNA polymerase-3 subunit delta
MQLMQSASTRHNASSLANILELAAIADGSIKGFADGKPWDNLESLILELAMPAKAVARSPGRQSPSH